MTLDDIVYVDDNPKDDICYTMKIAWRGDLYHKIIFNNMVDQKFES